MLQAESSTKAILKAGQEVQLLKDQTVKSTSQKPLTAAVTGGEVAWTEWVRKSDLIEALVEDNKMKQLAQLE